MTTVTIHDEACRAALLFAVWNRAWLENEEELYNRLDAEAWAVLEPATDTRDNYAGLVEQASLLSDTFADAHTIRTASPGEAVDVSASVEAFQDALKRCAERITEEQVGLWKGSVANRERLISIHDAAKRLIDELPMPAEAVA